MASNKSKSEVAIGELLAGLRNLVDDLALTGEVVAALFPSGKPHQFESELWDYKKEIPLLPDSPDDSQRKLHKAELGSIIKDIVAFHNSYGGYIAFGVTDKGKNRLIGCDGDFDCGDLNKRIQSYTAANIECLYKTVSLSQDGRTPRVGLLLVPRRPAGATPVRIREGGS